MKIDLVWFGALVAVMLQTAFLSPPVAMSAYYLKQVVKDWWLAHHLRRHVPVHDPAVHRDRADRRRSRRSPPGSRSSCRPRRAAVKTEEVDDSANRLEEDPLKAADQPRQEQEEEEEEGA